MNCCTCQTDCVKGADVSAADVRSPFWAAAVYTLNATKRTICALETPGTARSLFSNFAKPMERALGSQVGGVSGFLGFKCTKINLFARDIYLCFPLTKTMSNAKQTGLAVGVWSVLILNVLRVYRLSQIYDAIIKRFAINVIDLIRRPFPVYVQPRESVSAITFIANMDAQVSMIVMSGDSPDAHMIVPRLAPSKNASLWIVIKKVAQALCGKIVFSHDASFQRIGQRLARVFSTCGPCHFST